MINTDFNPFDMATHGLLSGNSFTMSIQGHLTIVEITPLPPTPIDKLRNFGGSFFPSLHQEAKPKKQRYKIKVTIIKNGEKYVEEKEVKSIKKPTIKDIQINFDEVLNKVIVEVKNPNIKLHKPLFGVTFFKK
jgi:hypothetical protein